MRSGLLRSLAFFILVLCGFAAAVRADQITLKNGDRLTGTIVKSDAKTLLIKTELAGDVNVQWDAITGIESSQPLHLTLKDGTVLVGQVTTKDGVIQVVTTNAGEKPAAKETVTAVRDDAEQKTFDVQEEKRLHPRITDFWSGLVDTGLSLTRGNSATLAYNLAAKAVRTAPRETITIDSTAIYASDDTTPPGRTTAKAIRGGVRGDFNVNAKAFVFAFTDFEYDEFQHLDLRNVIGGGGGYHFIKTKETVFDGFFGADFEQEYFSPNPPTVLDNVTRKTAEIVLGESYSKRLNGRTTFDEKLSLYPNASNLGVYRFQFDATAATKLKAWLAWQVTYSDRYLSDPLTGLKKNDLILATGLRLNLGKTTP
ncbi:MAG TPA: DUF481 domain-containing protein [Candidatus Acidoferrum sp.]|jgi:putative salt-induced outer membrane protein YdiY